MLSSFLVIMSNATMNLALPPIMTAFGLNLDQVQWVITAYMIAGAVMVLRLRNSLLTTLLFYDLMLAPGGIKTIDWMREDLASIDRAVEMAFWAREYLGLQIEVEGENGFEQRQPSLPSFHMPSYLPLGSSASQRKTVMPSASQTTQACSVSRSRGSRT